MPGCAFARAALKPRRGGLFIGWHASMPFLFVFRRRGICQLRPRENASGQAYLGPGRFPMPRRRKTKTRLRELAGLSTGHPSGVSGPGASTQPRIEVLKMWVMTSPKGEGELSSVGRRNAAHRHSRHAALVVPSPRGRVRVRGIFRRSCQKAACTRRARRRLTWPRAPGWCSAGLCRWSKRTLPLPGHFHPGTRFETGCPRPRSPGRP